MAETISVGIIGGGWPGVAHAKGYVAAGGFKVVAVADLIPERRKKMMAEFGIVTQYADAMDLIADKNLAAVSVCLPNHLHQSVALAALRAGKHVMCESPPALDAAEARRMAEAARRNGKQLCHAFQRRFGGAEQAAAQTLAKGYTGQVYHVRAAWTRTRSIPTGTGWYTDKAKAGGGALMDLGTQMLDLGWFLLGQPTPLGAFACAHQRFATDARQHSIHDVEDAAFGIVRFDGGKSLELSVAWAINQPPQQNGTVCRAYGDKGTIDVYTPRGAVLYRDFKPDGQAKATPLKPPKITHQAAMMRHFHQCIVNNSSPDNGASQGVTLMSMVDAMYKSIETGKSVAMK